MNRYLIAIIVLGTVFCFHLPAYSHDRASLINRADTLIPGILDFLSSDQGFLESLTVEERQQFEGLLGVAQVRRQFSGSYHGRFAFLRNGPETLPDAFGDTMPHLSFFSMLGQPDDNFFLNPEEGPRSAKTQSQFHADILFNPAIINSTEVPIGLFETIGILIHEFGHKIIVGKNQKAIDSVAVKILQALKPYQIKKSINGTEVEMISVPIRLSARMNAMRSGVMGSYIPLVIHTQSQSIDTLLDVTSAVAEIRQMSEQNFGIFDEIVIRLGKIELSGFPAKDGEDQKLQAKISFQFVNEFNRVTKELDPKLQIRKGRGFFEFKDRAELLFTGAIGQFEIETTLTVPPPRTAGSVIISPVLAVTTKKGVRVERDAGIEIQVKSWETTTQGLQIELAGKVSKLPLYLEMNSADPNEPPLLLEAVEVRRKNGNTVFEIKIPWMTSATFQRLVWPNMNAILDLPQAIQHELHSRAQNFNRFFSDYPPFIEQIRIDAVNLLDPSRSTEFVVELLVDSMSPLDYVDLRWVHGFEMFDTKNFNRDQSRLGHFGFMSHERVKVLSEEHVGRNLRLVTVKSTGGSHMELPKPSDPRFRFFSSGTRRLVSATIVNKDFTQNTILMTKDSQDLRPITKPGDHWAVPTRRGSPYLHPEERLRICRHLF